MRIAVLGGGNGSFAAAADLSDLGHDVSFWRRDAQALAAAIERGGLTLADASGRREVPIKLITADLSEAVTEAELIVLPTPAFSQADLASSLAPLLADDQVIFLPPGTFGSYAMFKALRASGCEADIVIGETGTLPYLTRKHGPAEVAINVRAVRLPTGFVPGHRAAHGFEVVSRAYPAVHGVEDGLSAALMNGGPIIHPPLILTNIGPLEALDRFDIHNEGTQPSVRRVMDALDDERIALREGLGYRPYHYPLKDTYCSDRWMYGDTHSILVESGNWREKIDLVSHRYMTEDVHYGLALMVSIADWLCCPAPVANGLLAIASAVSGRDLRSGPRTMESLGLRALTPDQVKTVLHEGTT